MNTLNVNVDEKTIEIVKATAPILAEHGPKITTRFYRNMFKSHPELLNIFNHANQKQGRQQQALANAVYAAAAHIDQLETIIPVVKQIGHKHRSLQVQPEQYKIVGKYLLQSIEEELGDQATIEVMKAWKKAYEVIADVFISVEKEMYDDVSEKSGGWNGFREFIVDEIIQESEVIKSYYLRPKDNGLLAEFLPGQYISLRFKIDGETYTHIRQYSLSDAPGKEYYRITVKKEEKPVQDENGIVSLYLHNQVQVGDRIEVSAPAGEFVLDTTESKPVVLISGGVGITPMISMLNTLVEKHPERIVTFIHAAQNSRLHAMSSHLKQMSSMNNNVEYYVAYERPSKLDVLGKDFHKEGFIDLAWLQTILKDKDADFYFCGPVPFMKAINTALTEWGVKAESIHYEFFGPAGTL